VIERAGGGQTRLNQALRAAAHERTETPMLKFCA